MGKITELCSWSLRYTCYFWEIFYDTNMLIRKLIISFRIWNVPARLCSIIIFVLILTAGGGNITLLTNWNKSVKMYLCQRNFNFVNKQAITVLFRNRHPRSNCTARIRRNRNNNFSSSSFHNKSPIIFSCQNSDYSRIIWKIIFL